MLVYCQRAGDLSWTPFLKVRTLERRHSAQPRIVQLVGDNKKGTSSHVRACGSGAATRLRHRIHRIQSLKSLTMIRVVQL